MGNLFPVSLSARAAASCGAASHRRRLAGSVKRHLPNRGTHSRRAPQPRPDVPSSRHDPGSPRPGEISHPSVEANPVLRGVVGTLADAGHRLCGPRPAPASMGHSSYSDLRCLLCVGADCCGRFSFRQFPPANLSSHRHRQTHLQRKRYYLLPAPQTVGTGTSFYPNYSQPHAL